MLWVCCNDSQGGRGSRHATLLSLTQQCHCMGGLLRWPAASMAPTSTLAGLRSSTQCSPRPQKQREASDGEELVLWLQAGGAGHGQGEEQCSALGIAVMPPPPPPPEAQPPPASTPCVVDATRTAAALLPAGGAVVQLLGRQGSCRRPSPGAQGKLLVAVGHACGCWAPGGECSLRSLLQLDHVTSAVVQSVRITNSCVHHSYLIAEAHGRGGGGGGAAAAAHAERRERMERRWGARLLIGWVCQPGQHVPYACKWQAGQSVNLGVAHNMLLHPAPPVPAPHKAYPPPPAAGTFEEKSISLAWVQEQLGALLGELRHSHQGASVAVEEVVSCRQARCCTAVGMG